MGKKFYKIRDPVTGWWHSPKDFDKPAETFPLAKILTSNGDKGIHSVGVINDPSELALEFGSTNGHKIPGLFDNVKARLKDAVAHYIDKGWLSDGDLADLGLEKMSTKLDGFKFPTIISQYEEQPNRKSTFEKLDLL